MYSACFWFLELLKASEGAGGVFFFFLSEHCIVLVNTLTAFALFLYDSIHVFHTSYNSIRNIAKRRYTQSCFSKHEHSHFAKTFLLAIFTHVSKVFGNKKSPLFRSVCTRMLRILFVISMCTDAFHHRTRKRKDKLLLSHALSHTASH